jgi:aspartate/methionine/tyrosine aminotransferase
MVTEYEKQRNYVVNIKKLGMTSTAICVYLKDSTKIAMVSSNAFGRNEVELCLQIYTPQN